MRPSFWALVRSVCLNSEGTQLVDTLVVLLFPILFLCARDFTHIYSGGDQEAVKELMSAKRMQQ
jgi:hypothetical protein